MNTFKEINKELALELVKKYHYSNTLPKLTKYCLGYYQNEKIIGMVTLGWGTRPRHTIQRIFPRLDTKDYLEIGRMCLIPGLSKNSATQMLSDLIKWLRLNLPQIKVLFTWADGMLGKAGIVYQAANFVYAGHSLGEFYLKEGIKIHPRQIRGLLGPSDENDQRIGVRPTLEQLQKFHIDHYKGQQFRYLYFLCSKQEKEQLLDECICKDELKLKPPKPQDISWKKRNLDSGKWETCGKPPYVTDFNRATKGIVEIE